VDLVFDSKESEIKKRTQTIIKDSDFIKKLFANPLHKKQRNQEPAAYVLFKKSKYKKFSEIA
jgi:hypothetical protein